MDGIAIVRQVGDRMWLSCGCVIDVQGEAFVIEPHAANCPVYTYVQLRLAAQGKPMIVQHLN